MSDPDGEELMAVTTGIFRGTGAEDGSIKA